MRLARPTALLALAVLMAACASPGPAATGQAGSDQPSATGSGAPPVPTPDWPTYHGDLARTGLAPGPAVTFRSAARDWQTPQLDADVYASPVLAGGTVVVATENDTLYAFDATSGARRWSHHIAQPVDASTLPCGDIKPVTGITGTPVVDVAHGVIYAVAFVRPAQHVLFAVDLDSGAIRDSRPIDPPGESPKTEQQRGALTLSDGTVYVPYGGLTGDCGQYHGWIVGTPVAGGDTLTYRVPCHRECALWAPGGPTVDAGGDLWVASGNGDSTTTYDFGNAVIRLTPALKLVDWFAPANWVSLSRSDLDLGSISPVLLGSGLVWISGKDGTGFLLRQDQLGHIGGQVASGKACASYGGTAYASDMLCLACSGEVAAVQVNTSVPSFSVRWQRPYQGPGAPVLAFGAVWSVETGSGRLLALDPRDGHQLFAYPGGSADHFVTAAVSGSRIYAALGQRLVAIGVRTAS